MDNGTFYQRICGYCKCYHPSKETFERGKCVYYREGEQSPIVHQTWAHFGCSNGHFTLNQNRKI